LELTPLKKAVALELARTGRFQVKAVAEALTRSNVGEQLKPFGCAAAPPASR
jgi:hypothetical protein